MSMPLAPAVRLKHLGRTFGDTAAVSNVSLDILRGEIVSLVGHSGCGKSTLLRIIAGVETRDRGSVSLAGTVVDGDKGFVEPERRNVGFVFQDYALFPHLSVSDNILFGLKKRSRREASAILSDVLQRIGIEHLKDRFPHTLSGGEQQRVALARALAPNPSVILLDEPFSNLDQGMRERVRDETLSVLRSSGTTVIMVTHDPEEALSSGDRVVLMRAGEIVQAGTARDLYCCPASSYAAEFFGAFNKIPGTWRDGLFDTAIGSFDLPAGVGGQDAQTLYIRPQAIKISLDHGAHAAELRERVFLGATEKAVLCIEGSDIHLSAVLTERLPADVSNVRFSIDTNALLAF